MDSSLALVQIDARGPLQQEAWSRLWKRWVGEGQVVSQRSRDLTMAVFGEPLSPQQVVERICGEVRREGSEALVRYSQKLDRSDRPVDQIRVPIDRLREAHRGVDPEFLQTVRRIRDRLMVFQKAILHQDVVVEPEPGLRLQQRYRPLERVGICVPGGAAAYPSTVLMAAVPAKAAGVKELVVMAPPTPFGADNLHVLATCVELGIEEVYARGGAQGVAALAYGTDRIRPVDMIVGPGNQFVALAKKEVFGQVAIDSIAGPSEVVVLADSSTPPDYAAADLLAQAEHAPGASVLISWEPSWMEEVSQSLRRQLAKLDRSEVTRQSLESYGALVLVDDLQQACQWTNRLAPEHLHVATGDPQSLVGLLPHAGATFLGPFAPVALGDYAAGPSHVLPTGGTARWASGLSSNHFLRSSSVIACDELALQRIGPEIERLATVEGLTAHRQSVTIRTQPHGGG
ncbi:MAG: histidinol dehydrogenase [Pirellulaceae bacterium]